MAATTGPARSAVARARGQVLAETAIALPVLLMVAIGLVQFALYYHAQNVVLIAVQDGARLAAAEDRTLREGVGHAQALLRAGLGPSAERVAIEGSDEQGAVTLRAQGRLRTVIPWVADASLPLSARATVSKEQFRAGRRD
jgi:Flp pilus assembly protein TadG